MYDAQSMKSVPSFRTRHHRLAVGLTVVCCTTLVLVLTHDWFADGVLPDTSIDSKGLDQLKINKLSESYPLTVAGAPELSLYGCVLETTCNVKFRNGQLAVNSNAAPAAPLVDLLTTTLLRTSTTLLFVIEDGCALGHLMKDDGVLLELVQRMSTLRMSAPRIEMHVIFGNRCATRTAWNAAAATSGGSGDRSLFATILAPWWWHVISLVDALSSGVIVRSHVKIGFADEWDGWVSENALAIAAGNVMIIRRPVRWRWFYQPSHGGMLRNIVLRGMPQSIHVQPSRIVITIIKRRKNRRFQETSVQEVAQAIAKPWNTNARHSSLIYVQVVDPEGMSFNDQVLLFASTDILVAAHGAALALTMFMDPSHSVVVELFPFRFGYWIYEELAMSVGLDYQIVRGQRPSESCSRKSACASAAQVQPAINSDLYSALREWNGHSSCKNCDVMWCRLAAVAKEGAALNETQCLYDTMLPLLRDAVRRVAMKKIRRGASLGAVNSGRWLDRRS
jgi:hypothetical protein